MTAHNWIRKRHSSPSGVLDLLTKLLGGLNKLHKWFQGVQLGGEHREGRSLSHVVQRENQHWRPEGRRNLSAPTGEIRASPACSITLMYRCILWITERVTSTSSLFNQLAKSEILQLVHRCTLNNRQSLYSHINTSHI